MTDHIPTADAVSILVDAADAITERGKQRDQACGERSMGRTVRAFNAMFGGALTEHQGWQFMALLKMARSTGGALRLDDYTDQAGYAALAGECAAREQALIHHAAQCQQSADKALHDLHALLAQRANPPAGHAL